jgi:hypothetical protein
MGYFGAVFGKFESDVTKEIILLDLSNWRLVKLCPNHFVFFLCVTKRIE